MVLLSAGPLPAKSGFPPPGTVAIPALGVTFSPQTILETQHLHLQIPIRTHEFPREWAISVPFPAVSGGCPALLVCTWVGVVGQDWQDPLPRLL